MLFILLGLGPLLEHVSVKITIKYVGSTPLILMGLQLIKDALNIGGVEVGRSLLTSNSSVPDMSTIGLIVSGFLASCSNPYFLHNRLRTLYAIR